MDDIMHIDWNGNKRTKAGFLSMLFGTSAASWLGNLLTSKGVIRAGEGMFSGGQDF